MKAIKTKKGLVAAIQRHAAERRLLTSKLDTAERDLRAVLLQGYKKHDMTAIELAEVSGLNRANVYDWLRREKGYKPKRKKKTAA